MRLVGAVDNDGEMVGVGPSASWARFDAARRAIMVCRILDDWPLIGEVPATDVHPVVWSQTLNLVEITLRCCGFCSREMALRGVLGWSRDKAPVLYERLLSALPPDLRGPPWAQLSGWRKLVYDDDNRVERMLPGVETFLPETVPVVDEWDPGPGSDVPGTAVAYVPSDYQVFDGIFGGIKVGTGILRGQRQARDGKLSGALYFGGYLLYPGDCLEVQTPFLKEAVVGVTDGRWVAGRVLPDFLFRPTRQSIDSFRLAPGMRVSPLRQHAAGVVPLLDEDCAVPEEAWAPFWGTW